MKHSTGKLYRVANDEQRSVLVSARLQFSPEVQEIREHAIDTCVEHVLYGLHTAAGIRLNDIQEVLTANLSASRQLFDSSRLLDSLSRLRLKGRLVAVVEGAGTTYRLVDSALAELSQAESEARDRLERIARRLFTAAAPFDAYVNAFFDVLCVIFSQLGEQYVRILRGKLDAPAVSKSAVFISALRLIRARHRQIDHAFFGAMLTHFFETADPDFDSLKWNLAQNYYVAKCLGVDGSGQLLSRELFGGAVLYLDTNVLLHALDPEALHHRSFTMLLDACEALGIDVQVCQISLDEMRSLVAANRMGFVRAAGAIPEGLASKVNNIFYDAYRRAQMAGPVDAERIFAAFDDPSVKLAARKVEVIDDVWFSDTSDARVSDLADAIQKRSERRRGHPKTARSSTHDAKLLMWATRERETIGRKVWVVTLDRALPTFRVSAGAADSEPVAITLDALLQWISPLGVDSESEADLAEVFAQTIKYHVLPSENFFDLSDFIVFAELEWDCRVLPATHVEACIRHLRAVAGSLNPRSATDREKLARILRKFFADPARKISEERAAYEELLANYEETNERQEVDHAAEMAKLQAVAAAATLTGDDAVRDLSSVREEIAELRASLKTAQADQQTRLEEIERAKKVIRWFRRSCSALVFVAGTLFVLWLSRSYGDGTNAWRQICSSWPLICPAEVFLMYVSTLVAGKANIGPFARDVRAMLS